MAIPRDIALAIRIRPGTSERVTNDEEGEKMEDLFDEIGMEYLEEGSLPEDDDERRESSSYLQTSYPQLHFMAGGFGGCGSKG